MPFEKGHSGNQNGRPLGKKNEITQQVRESFTLLLENKLPEMDEWLTKLAKTNPDKALDIMLKISERFVPKITKQEITGADGKNIWEGIKFNFGSPLKDKEEE